MCKRRTENREGRRKHTRMRGMALMIALSMLLQTLSPITVEATGNNESEKVITETPTEEPTETPTETLTEELMETPTEELKEELPEELTETLTEEPIEELTEETVVDVKDYSIYKDANLVADEFINNVETVVGEVDVDADEVAEIALPIFGVSNIEETDEADGLYYLLTGGITEANGREIVEYGFVWNYGETVPTLVENDGMISFADAANMETFSHQFLANEANGADVTFRVFAIYDEWVAYSAKLSKSDEAIVDGLLQPLVFQANTMSAMNSLPVTLAETANDGPATYVFGTGGNFDQVHAQAGLLNIQITDFDIDLGNRVIDPNEDVYIAIKGVLAGLITVKVNGVSQGSVGSCVKPEYYFLKVSGSTLKQGKNTIRLVHTYGLISWDNIDNIQILFEGGCGSLEAGKTAQINNFDFLDYTIDLGLWLEKGWSDVGTQWVIIDGVADFEIPENETRKGYVSLSLDYDQVAAKQYEIEAKNGQQTVTSKFFDSIGFAQNAVDTIMMTLALTETAPAGSAWEDEEIITSIAADFVEYDGDEEPREYEMLFDYDKQYYSTDKQGPLEINVEVESVFGEPVSYISMPKDNSVAKCEYSDSNKNEGVSLAGQFVDADGLETTDGYVVSVNPYDRVYSRTTTFYVETNGIYEFTATGAKGTETFYLYVTNIDNDKPTVELVGGDSELTLLEGNDYEDLGVGAYDNRSFEDELEITVDYDGLYDSNSLDAGQSQTPNSGVHNVVYSIKDEAGNIATINKNVTITGQVKSLGEISIVERGLVWDLTNAPTVTNNSGKYAYKYNVYCSSTR